MSEPAAMANPPLRSGPGLGFWASPSKLESNGFEPGFINREIEQMSQLMELAIQKVKQLPEEDQESIASIILQEIESEHRWEELFARPESADLLSRMADEALAEARAGHSRKLDVNEL
jgi:hypothetical protein